MQITLSILRRFPVASKLLYFRSPTLGPREKWPGSTFHIISNPETAEVVLIPSLYGHITMPSLARILTQRPNILHKVTNPMAQAISIGIISVISLLYTPTKLTHILSILICYSYITNHSQTHLETTFIITHTKFWSEHAALSTIISSALFCNFQY